MTTLVNRIEAGVQLEGLRVRGWWRSVALMLTVVMVLHGVALLNQVYVRPFDYPTHIRWARLLAEGEFHPGGVKIEGSYRPAYLFQALVYGVALLPSIDHAQGAIVVSLLATAALALTVYHLLYRALPEPDRATTGLIAALLTLVVLLVAPLTFRTWHRENLYLGYITPIVYHNPTVTLLRPFALLLFLYAVKALDAAAGVNRAWAVPVAAVLTVLATYAKPNYTLALLPVMGGLLALRWLRRQPVDTPLILFGILLPGVVVLGLQFWFTYESSENNSVIFSPLTVARMFEPNYIFAKLALSLVFPGLVSVLYLRPALRDWSVVLAWLALGVALAYVYLLAESGMPGDGNFFWGAQVTLLILVIVTMRLLIRQELGTDRRGPSWRAMACAGALALHLAAGVAWYLSEALLPGPSWW